MKGTGNTILAWSAVLSVVFAGTALATPVPNGATIQARTFNDCPISTLTTTNIYPTSIEITDEMHPLCDGFANLHSWSFSEDGGSTAAVFNNDSTFCFGADVRIAGAGEGEGGLRVSPWFSQFVDGRCTANTSTGEIACFGGRLPFYSFTASQGITYVKGATIHMEVAYQANGLSAADPATIQYRLIQGGTPYASPVLPFDMGNAGDDPPYGLWGILNDARAGGFFQPRANTGASLTATWSDIEFSQSSQSCLAAPSDLTLQKTGLEGPTGTVVYTLVVTNNGPGGATGVVVTDPIPAALDYVSDDCVGSDLPPWTWNVGALASTGSATCHIVLSVNQAGPVDNTATVTGDQLDPTPGNEASTATLVVSEALSVVEIPTLGALGALLLGGLLAGTALWTLRRRHA